MENINKFFWNESSMSNSSVFVLVARRVAEDTAFMDTLFLIVRPRHWSGFTPLKIRIDSSPCAAVWCVRGRIGCVLFDSLTKFCPCQRSAWSNMKSSEHSSEARSFSHKKRNTTRGTRMVHPKRQTPTILYGHPLMPMILRCIIMTKAFLGVVNAECHLRTHGG